MADIVRLDWNDGMVPEEPIMPPPDPNLYP